MATQSTPTPQNNTLKSILLPGIRNFVMGVIVLGAVIFLLAGTLNYWQGWVFIFLFMGLMTHQGIYLAMRDPALLERRKKIAQASESRGQKVVLVLGLVSMFGLMIFAPLDYRFGWSKMPAVVSVVGDALLVFSFYLYYLVFRENSYAASSIQTFEGQKVVSTGLYALVRHPKYVGDLVMVVGISLALGSWWGLAVLIITFPALAWRILDEEKLLRKDLSGYIEYMQQVRYRLVPHVW